jgi:enamine deaminase RidA (YjgF/YER057c/UK114 family)
MELARLPVENERMSELEIILPEGWPRPAGYANGVVAPAGSRALHVAGQIAWDAERQLVGAGDFAAQFAQALDNVIAVVRAGGGEAAHIACMTVYVTDKRQYLDALGAVGASWTSRCGRHYPAMALVEVAGLLEEGALIEIAAVAYLP